MVMKAQKYRFKGHVYKPPFAPFYDNYKGHTFVIVEVHEGDHLELLCVDDPTVKVDGYVHREDVELTV